MCYTGFQIICICYDVLHFFGVLFYNYIPDDKHNNTQYVKQEYK